MSKEVEKLKVEIDRQKKELSCQVAVLPLLAEYTPAKNAQQTALISAP